MTILTMELKEVVRAQSCNFVLTMTLHGLEEKLSSKCNQNGASGIYIYTANAAHLISVQRKVIFLIPQKESNCSEEIRFWPPLLDPSFVSIFTC